jgi:electron-transferring-flavoprotein dehydrogenase
MSNGDAQAGWETEGRIAENARNGFQRDFVGGMFWMGMAGLTKGLAVSSEHQRPTHERLKSIEDYFSDRVPLCQIERVRAIGGSMHDRLMDLSGWPPIQHDGQLLVSHQDALLIGGKVQGSPGAGDHVHFIRQDLCDTCRSQICIEMCSGEAIAAGKDRTSPVFDREKCVHCGACLWNCSRLVADLDRVNIEFRAGGGGLHSAEN